MPDLGYSYKMALLIETWMCNIYNNNKNCQLNYELKNMQLSVLLVSETSNKLSCGPLDTLNEW